MPALTASCRFPRTTASPRSARTRSTCSTSRGAISATERANYILRVRTIAKACCEAYLELVASKTDADNKKEWGSNGRHLGFPA